MRYWQVSNTIYARKSMPLGQGGDLIYYDPSLGGRMTVVPKLVDLLEETMPHGATLVAMPDGTLLNYLLRAPSTTRHSLLSPWEIAAAGGEVPVLRDLSKRPADFIVVFQMSMEEHGHAYFGDARYGGQIMKWIEAHYDAPTIVRGFNEQGEVEVQALLFRRRPRSSSPDPAAARPN
jgi:hypothetical protein